VAYGRAFPMLMTAAGTISAAKLFVLGAGVAGLQAIATARRLGAVVSATDVRAAAKEEIKSLGASFVGAEPDQDAQTAGGYAKAMTPEFLAKQAEIVAAHLAKQDIAVCTALTQGRAAPRLITAKMVEAMRPGSVIVDIAAEAGGNCELTRAGEAVTTPNGVTILGWRNWPARLPAASSALYAKNLLTFLSTFWDKEAKAPALKPDDEIIKGVMLTRDGAIVHPQFAPKPAEAA
jgi:NAD(P) transhydrogenase subunit alpha